MVLIGGAGLEGEIDLLEEAEREAPATGEINSERGRRAGGEGQGLLQLGLGEIGGIQGEGGKNEEEGTINV